MIERSWLVRSKRYGEDLKVPDVFWGGTREKLEYWGEGAGTCTRDRASSSWAMVLPLLFQIRTACVYHAYLDTPLIIIIERQISPTFGMWSTGINEAESFSKNIKWTGWINPHILFTGIVRSRGRILIRDTLDFGSLTITTTNERDARCSSTRYFNQW